LSATKRRGGGGFQKGGRRVTPPGHSTQEGGGGEEKGFLPMREKRGPSGEKGKGTPFDSPRGGGKGGVSLGRGEKRNSLKFTMPRKKRD